MAGLEQVRQCSLVCRLAATLVNDGTVPLEAVGLQRLQDAVRRPRLRPGRIDILDADQPGTAAMASLQVAGSRGKQGAEVQGPGG